MLDPRVTQLLENGINTSCKLAVVLRFVEQPELCAAPQDLAARICRDIWSVETAISELVEDGILARCGNRYCCSSSADLRARLRLLQEAYTYPLQRIELLGLLHDLERYAPYRNEFPRRAVISRVA